MVSALMAMYEVLWECQGEIWQLCQGCFPQVLPGPWRLRGLLSGGEFGEGRPGRGGNVNKATQKWPVHTLISFQPQIPLVT